MSRSEERSPNICLSTMIFTPPPPHTHTHAHTLTLAGLNVNHRSNMVNPILASLPISF